MTRTWTSSLLLGGALLLTCITNAHAVPIKYQFVLQAEEFTGNGRGWTQTGNTFCSSFDEEDADGNVITIVDNCFEKGQQFIGTFSIDDALLSLEGDELHAQMYSFNLSVGTYEWDMLRPHPLTQFSGFEGPGHSLRFSVSNGAITALGGGVHDDGDVSFMHFQDNSRFIHCGFGDCNDRINGPMTFHRVPEPSILVMFFLTCCMLLLSRYSRQCRTQRG
jgi:hypothetical protein